ncbi:MAG: TlpA family protein disulfide reductase, partial [Candidatus Symbiothrix sp.]|nr:TlpA family protein disulfide reductase [Candidatus Symbiothrix sp.]
NGKPQTVATVKTGPNGEYGFLFVPEAAGFYILSNDRQEYLLYIQPGDQLQLNILKDQVEWQGSISQENKALYQWLDASDLVRQKALFFWSAGRSTYEDFFPDFEALLSKTATIKQQIHSGNKSFDQLLRTKMDYDLDYYFTNFLYTPRTKHPKKEDMIAFYQSVNPTQKLAGDDLLLYPEGIKMMNNYLLFARVDKGIQDTSPDFELAYIRNPILKSDFTLRALKRAKTQDEYEAFMKFYGQYILPEQIKEAEKFGSSLYKVQEGVTAADFSYPDTEGNLRSLSDFRGKVVLVDVWATWCGHCRREFPALKKLAEEMKNKDFVVIGISIDKEKDKVKWVEMIQTQGLPGVQIWSGPGSKVMNDYQIKGIPRCLVFDKQGRVVSPDAPPPSDDALKALLIRELEK